MPFPDGLLTVYVDREQRDLVDRMLSPKTWSYATTSLAHQQRSSSSPAA
jgi:hypothetical protein